MKKTGTWGAVFVLLLGLAYLVDHGETKAGVPVFVWLALNLTLFLFLLARFVGRPLTAFLDARQESIGAQLREAEARLHEAETLREKVAERLGAIETEVLAINERAEEQGRANAARIGEEAAAEEERFLRRIQEEIQRRGAETREDLARETARLTQEITRKVLQTQLTETDRTRLLEQSVSALKTLEEK